LVGVNVVDNGCVPAVSAVPAAGVYTKVPGTFAVAFNCVTPSTVPATTDAGFAHVITGVVCVVPPPPGVHPGAIPAGISNPLVIAMYTVQSGNVTFPFTMTYVAPLYVSVVPLTDPVAGPPVPGPWNVPPPPDAVTTIDTVLVAVV
jgi:hypothetical protein